MRAAHTDDVLVAGLGAATPFGDLDATWRALLDGRTAVQHDGPGVLRARIEAPTLDVEAPRALMTQIKFLNGSGVLAAAATHAAWQEAAADDVPEARRGLYLAQVDGDDWNCSDFRNAAHAATDDLSGPLPQDALNKASMRQVVPFFLLNGLKNNAFSFVAQWFGLHGSNTSSAGVTCLGGALLETARAALRDERLERAVLTGAARISSATGVHELATLGLLRPGTAEHAAPYTDRDAGLVPGDAAASLVLALRGADTAPGVTLRGMGTSTFATAQAAARSGGLESAVRAAMREAEATPADIAAIVAPGTGLPTEREALAALATSFGATPVTCFAGHLGHAGVAADALHLVLAAHALREGTLPGAYLPAGAAPTLPDLATTPVALAPGSAVLVLALGTPGHAGAVVLAG